MNWLDGVLAVPGIGIRIRTDFTQVERFRAILTDFIQKLTPLDGDITITPKEVWGYEIHCRDSGFRFDIHHHNIVGRFSYNLRGKKKAGALATIKEVELRPYSKILDEVHEYLNDFLNMIRDLDGITYDRIGIVADMNLDEASLPPGARLLIDHIGRLWSGKLTKTDTVLLVNLRQETKIADQCHHRLNFDERRLSTSGFSLGLDWQRVMSQSVPFKLARVLQDVEKCKVNALEYFERFGRGEFSDA